VCEGDVAQLYRSISWPELSPEYATSHQWYGLYLYRVGRTDEALTELLTAKRLEPYSLVMRNFLSRLYFYTREHDKGIEESRAAIEISPGYWQARLLLAFHHFAREENDEGIEQLERAVELANVPYCTTTLATLYGYTGRTQEAIALMDEPHVTSGDEAVRAEVYRGLGESKKALDWLETGYENRAIGLVELKIDWRWDSIRHEPRFQEIMRKMNFPEN